MKSLVLGLIILLLGLTPLDAESVAVAMDQVPPASSSVSIKGDEIVLRATAIENRMPRSSDDPPSVPYAIVHLENLKWGCKTPFFPEAAWSVTSQGAWSVSLETEATSSPVLECTLRGVSFDTTLVMQMRLEDGTSITLQTKPKIQEVW